MRRCKTKLFARDTSGFVEEEEEHREKKRGREKKREGASGTVTMETAVTVGMI